MSTLLGLALRNVARTPRRTAIVSLAISGGCAALVFMIGMNNGLAELMLSNVVGLTLGHVQVDSARGDRTVPEGPVLAAAAAIPDVVGATGRVEVPGIVQRIDRSHGVLLLGVDTERERTTSSLPSLVAEGRLPRNDEETAATVGVVLAQKLGLVLGDALKVRYLDTLDSVRTVKLTVVGFARTGSDDLDERLVEIPLATAQRLLGEAGSARVLVRAARNDQADRVASELARTLDPAVYRVRPWHAVSLYAKGLVAFQYGSANVVLLVLYLVVGAGVAAIQLMSIVLRTREFGVLSSIGFRPRDVVTLVALETLVVGAVAIVVGLLLGAAAATLVDHLGGIDVRLVGGENLEGLMGLDSHLRPVLGPRIYAYAAGLLAPVLLLGGVLPALRAARLTPMEALRRP